MWAYSCFRNRQEQFHILLPRSTSEPPPVTTISPASNTHIHSTTIIDAISVARYNTLKSQYESRGVAAYVAPATSEMRPAGRIRSFYLCNATLHLISETHTKKKK